MWRMRVGSQGQPTLDDVADGNAVNSSKKYRRGNRVRERSSEWFTSDWIHQPSQNSGEVVSEPSDI